jgi:DNA end-binding protein Ku
MAKMLIDSMSVDEFEPEKFTNRYHDELLAMIEARAAGKELPQPKKAPARAKVVNLMDVLQQSLEESKKQRGGRAAQAPKRAAHRVSPSRGGRKKKSA